MNGHDHGSSGSLGKESGEDPFPYVTTSFSKMMTLGLV